MDNPADMPMVDMPATQAETEAPHMTRDEAERLLQVLHDCYRSPAMGAREAYAEARAAVLAAMTRATPEGWKLVPVEPTDEMINAAYRFWPNPENPGTSLLEGYYAAMLAAAPEAAAAAIRADGGPK